MSDRRRGRPRAGSGVAALTRASPAARSEIAVAASLARTLPFARLGIDKLGVVVATLLAIGAASPFVVFRANRIAAGEARPFFEALPASVAALFALAAFAAAGVALSKTPARARLATAIVFVVAVAGLIGIAADHLTPAGDRFARVAPAAGFWALAFAGSILFADSVVRLKLGPLARAPGARARRGGLRAGAVVGVWSELSILKEYATPRRRVLARGRRASRSRGRFARRGDGGRPAARRPDRAQDGMARARAQYAQRDPDDPVDRAVRHPDRAARLGLRPRTRRRGARRPRHRRRAGVPGALSLFAAADGGQHRRRPRPGAARRRRRRRRHGHDRPPAAVLGRAAAGAACHPDRRSHRPGPKYRTWRPLRP